MEEPRPRKLLLGKNYTNGSPRWVAKIPKVILLEYLVDAL